MKTKHLFIEVTWRLLLLLFLYTALNKILNFTEFTGKINNQPFDDKYTPFLSYAVPAVELALGILLLSRHTRLLGFIGSALVMLGFTLYVALVTFNYFPRVPCSCAGVFQTMTWPQHLIFNIIFLVLAITGTIIYRSNKDQVNHNLQFENHAV